MPVFEYRGLNEAGKNVSGLKEADSGKTLRALLRKDGVYLTDIIGQADGRGSNAKANQGAASKDIQFKKLARGRISTEDIAITTRQLATLLKAGVPLVDSLTALVDQVEKEQFKRILSEVKQRVNEGSSLADALSQHQNVFGSLYVNMIRAGEHSGAMDAVLMRLAEFTEGQAQLRNKILATMMYPVLMSLVGGGVLILLMTVVVPQVTQIFKTMKATLPWTTKSLIWTSEFLQDWWFIFFPAILGAIAGLYFWIKSPKGKPVWDRFTLKVPIFGSLVRMLAVARFSRTLSTLLSSGVPLLTAMDIVKNVITNSILSDVVDKTRDAVREGESIAAPLKRSGEFPPLVYHMVSVGERSGQLEEMLLNVADSYEAQVSVRIGALTSLLEPLLIIVMGGIIAFVAFSILMPIMQINQSIR